MVSVISEANIEMSPALSTPHPGALKIPTSPRQYMMHNSLHQFPALGLRLHQPRLQFIAEGHEMVDFKEDRAGFCGDRYITCWYNQTNRR